jgi:DNA repair protein RadC
MPTKKAKPKGYVRTPMKARKGYKPPVRLDGSDSLYAQCVDFRGNKETMRVFVWYMNDTGRVLKRKEIQEGGKDLARAIFTDALRLGADAMAIAHNHPNGSLEVEEHDEEASMCFQALARILHIELRDDLIVTEDGYKSIVAHTERKKPDGGLAVVLQQIANATGMTLVNVSPVPKDPTPPKTN